MIAATTSELKPVLVFDSGIGGLTVLREARLLMPERGFIYVADDAGFPYGGWEEEPLKVRIVSLFRDLLAAYDPEAVIVACNTAFTLAGADLRAAFPAMRFIGTVPAVKPAAERTRSGLVSVLATPGTVKRAYTRDLIQSFASQCHVRLVGSENLARMAEAYIRGEALDDACPDGYRRACLYALSVPGQCLSPSCTMACRLARSGRSDCATVATHGPTGRGGRASRWVRFCRIYLRAPQFFDPTADAGHGTVDRIRRSCRVLPIEPLDQYVGVLEVEPLPDA